MSTNVQGYVALLLHAHIPYVRHNASEITLEERWFFEAVVDTYLPLIDMMERLIEDRGAVPSYVVLVSAPACHAGGFTFTSATSQASVLALRAGAA